MIGSPLKRLRARILAHIRGQEHADALRWILDHRLILLESEPGLAPALKKELRKRRHSIAAGNALAIQAYQEVADILHPVDVMPIKGLVLLDSLYAGKDGMRPLKDLDLLVPGAAIEESIAKLELQGWREVAQSRLQRGLDHERTLKKGWLTLDIHERLSFVYGHRTQFHHLPSEVSVLHDRSVYRLSPAAELVYAMVHCYKHGLFSSLLWIDEILALAERGTDIPSEQIFLVAERMGCRHPLAVTTTLLREALGEDVLPQVDLERLSPNFLRLKLQRMLFVPPQIDPLEPFPLPPKILEKFHSALLADSAKDTLFELWRSLRLTLRARLGTEGDLGTSSK